MCIYLTRSRCVIVCLSRCVSLSLDVCFPLQMCISLSRSVYVSCLSLQTCISLERQTITYICLDMSLHMYIYLWSSGIICISRFIFVSIFSRCVFLFPVYIFFPDVYFDSLIRCVFVSVHVYLYIPLEQSFSNCGPQPFRVTR